MPKTPKIPKELEYDFIKSNFFRVIHADGAFGGLAPNGNVHMALYSERRAIPTKVIHAVVNGELGPEIPAKRQGRKGLVREVEIDVVMTIEQAEALRMWLVDKIESFQKITGTTVVVRQPGMLKPVDGKSGNGSKRTVRKK